MKNIMTIAFQYDSKDNPFVKALMDSFVEDKELNGVKVYAVSTNCLFEEIELLEDNKD